MNPFDGRSVAAADSATSDPPARWRRWLDRGIALAAALVIFAALAAWYSRNTYNALPGTVHLQLNLPAGIAGATEPILVTGMFGEGDLVIIKYLDEQTAEFAYDHWGFGGPNSKRIRFQPGSSHSLEISLPSLTTFHKPAAGSRGLVRLAFDGREILREELPYHGRLPKQAYFGENAIGGNAAPSFRGTLARSDGHTVRGGPESYFTLAERALIWMRTKRWPALGAACGSLVAGLLFARFLRSQIVRAARQSVAGACAARRNEWRSSGADQPATAALTSHDLPGWRGDHRWFLASAALATIGYAWLVTLGTFNFNYAEVFGSFYDYQAASLLKGRLDVPEEAIQGEAFEAGGKLYGYFGPTPALLRMPFVIFGLGFGKLSRAFMLLYFVATLAAAYLILRDAWQAVCRRRDRPADDPPPFAVVVMVASVGFGSTVFFLGSRGLIFHEAILAGITFSLWSCWCSLRHLQSPSRRRWIAALVFGVLSLHARPPTGLFALTLLGCVVVVLAVRDWWRYGALGRIWPRLLRHAGVGVLCAAGLLTLNGLAYLKFKTFDPAPLRISRPYQNNDRLAHIDGKSFHAVNVPFNFYTYVLRANFRIEASFPWIYVNDPDTARYFPKAKIDLPDHTLAVPFSMPSLFLLAIAGGMAAFITVPGHRWPLVVIWMAAVPVIFALFAAVATAQRYTGDFCPLLITAAAFGLAALDSVRNPWRMAHRALIALATVTGVAVTLAITLQYQGDYLWGVPKETQQNYQQIRRRVDAFFGYAAERPK